MSPKVSSRLVWECLGELEALARRNRIKLFWVPGHSGIQGNEKADELARQGSSASYLGPEPVLGIPKCMARSALKLWIREKQNVHWRNRQGHRHSKAFIQGPSSKTAKELLMLSRNKLRITTGLLTGHMAVKCYLNKLNLYQGSLCCRLCDKDPETAEHIICHCEALDRKRHFLFGKARLEPEELCSHPIKDLHKLVQGTGIGEWVQI